jgi:hypothetical protein
MPEVPRPRNPPRDCPHPQPLGLGQVLRCQIGAPIATAQILPIDKRLAALDHRQVQIHLSDHLRHGAPVADHGLRQQRQRGPNSQPRLQCWPNHLAKFWPFVLKAALEGVTDRQSNW